MTLVFYIITGFLIMTFARMWQQKYIEKLNDEFKSKLVGLLATKHNWLNYISIASLVLFTLISVMNLIEIRNAFFIFTIINVLSVAVSMNINYNKLVKAEFPIDFINNYLITAALRIIGVIVIFSYMFFQPTN
ncbi:MAG: hypothetical protein V4538_01360 [Bacteroidota bacterium]